MFRAWAYVALVVLGATTIGQGGLRAADEDVAGNRDQMLARMLELSKDTQPGIYFNTVQIPKELDRYRALALAVGNLGRRNPDFREKNGSTVATNLRGASVIIDGKEETIVKNRQTPPYFNDLVLNDTLNKAAQFQAEYQAAVKFGHDGPDNFNGKSMKTLSDRLTYFNYTGGTEGEGCGGGFIPTDDPEGLMKGDTHFRPWFNIGHDIREMGMGIALDANDAADGRKYRRDSYIAGWPAGTPQPPPASSFRKESARRAPPVGVIKSVDLARSSLILKKGSTERKYTLAKNAKVTLADGKPARPGVLAAGMSVLELTMAPKDPTMVTGITVQQDPAPKTEPKKDPAPKSVPAPAPANAAAYSQHMKAGNTAVQQKKSADAVKEFQAALQIMPGDRAATAALNQAKAQLEQGTADYNRHMKNGQAALQAKKYPEAVKEFEAALRIRAGDRQATASLKQAKDLLNKK